VRLEFHGGLRDFFPNSRDFALPDPVSARELLDILRNENPLAANLLQNTRVADNERMLDSGEMLKPTGTYHLLPPPGGG
jgi:hypothetical protein